MQTRDQSVQQPRDPNALTWQQARDLGINGGDPEMEPATQDEWID